MSDLNTQLSQCDEEQIQFIASIQPFGSLLVSDGSGRILYAAVEPEMRARLADPLGQSIEGLLPSINDRVQKALEGRTEPTTPSLLRSSKLNSWITCIAHKQGEYTIFEIETAQVNGKDVPSVKFMKERRDSIDSYLSFIAENVRLVTGYDRVMIYRFASDWHGEVVAEAKNSDAHAFYGHHFPASDIPAPARSLFTQNWVRLIADVNAVTVPLQAAPGAPKQIDLTKSVLRAPSEIHLEYLRNMGVAASLTLSLICDGQLWGLIACHHFTPKYLGAEERSVLSLVAKVVSGRITSMSVNTLVDATERVGAFMQNLNERMSGHEQLPLINAVRDYKNDLWKMIGSDGFSFTTSDTTITEGHAPTLAQTKGLIKSFDSSGETLVHTNSISSAFPELADLKEVAAGIMAIRIGDHWCIWNRHEVVKSLLWAGDPNKPLYTQDQHQRLSPRSSFDTWREQVKGTSIEWHRHDIEAASILRGVLLEKLAKQDRPQRLKADSYLQVLRRSIDLQASELQNHFTHLDLKSSLPADES